MSALVKNPYETIESAQSQFDRIIAEDDTGVDFEKEKVYAYDALIKSQYIENIAMKNPNSVKMAVIKIASIGLSLNPATSYAYLVPRGGSICLDISYMGLIKVATDSGSILWARAGLIYEGDEFVYKGPAEMPEINVDPFAKGKEKIEGFLGAYCIAKTCDSDYLVETMPAEEVLKIRDEASEAAKRKQGPWYSYFGEMAKKAVIKRASKTWPKTQRHERVQKAVEIINETEGSDWAEVKHRFKSGEKVQIINGMREALQRGDELGVRELVEEYSSTNPDQYEESMKFWALFTSAERASIHKLMDDTPITQERITMDIDPVEVA